MSGTKLLQYFFSHSQPGRVCGKKVPNCIRLFLHLLLLYPLLLLLPLILLVSLYISLSVSLSVGLNLVLVCPPLCTLAP
jgi:hypothetical protein